MTERSLDIPGRRATAAPYSGMAGLDPVTLEPGARQPAVPPPAILEPAALDAALSDTAVLEPVTPEPAPQTAASGEATAAAGGAVATDVDVTTDLLTRTYQTHYSSLLRLAALLLDDLGSCEDVVQEAFIRVHAARGRVREPDKLLAYLRQTVVNLSRSTLRRRLIGLRLLPKPLPDAASAEEGAYDALERDALIQALRGLQRRQREVLVLRYFADLTEAQVAQALGVSIGSVKAYGSRGIEALRVRMEEHR